jgi:outer membrane PBP1 activator LpoA protein
MMPAFKCLLVLLFACVLSGCGGSDQNQLATEGATADDLAKYEAELAATNSDSGYDESVPAE